MVKNGAPFTARWYPPRDTQSRGPSLILQTATFCIAMDAKRNSSFAAKNKKGVRNMRSTFNILFYVNI